MAEHEKKINKRQLEITRTKVSMHKKLNGYDWRTLRKLVYSRFLCAKDKQLRQELLKILYSIEDEYLDEEEAFTRKCIQNDFIVHVYHISGLDSAIRDIKLEKKSSKNVGWILVGVILVIADCMVFLILQILRTL